MGSRLGMARFSIEADAAFDECRVERPAASGIGSSRWDRRGAARRALRRTSTIVGNGRRRSAVGRWWVLVDVGRRAGYVRDGAPKRPHSPHRYWVVSHTSNDKVAGSSPAGATVLVGGRPRLRCASAPAAWPLRGFEAAFRRCAPPCDTHPRPGSNIVLPGPQRHWRRGPPPLAGAAVPGNPRLVRCSTVPKPHRRCRPCTHSRCFRARLPGGSDGDRRNDT